MKTKVIRSSGNVFQDLGFPREEAEHFHARSDLMIHLRKVLHARGLTQTQAARLMGVTQPRVSSLMKGRVDLFSVDTLIDLLARMGVSVKIGFKPARHRKVA